MKRAPRPAKALQSPYIVVEGKQIKPSGHVVPFKHYNQNVDDLDVADFQNWFQRGYKPHNKKKFSDKDDHIRPPFVVGEFMVGNKICWYELVSREVSLSSSGMNKNNVITNMSHTNGTSCFTITGFDALTYLFIVTVYGCLLLLHMSIGKKWSKYEIVATTTDSLFQAKLKNIYPKFKQDANVVLNDSSLLNDITGAHIPLSAPWSDVDIVLLPILPTNKDHWMLGVLDIKKQQFLVFNSSMKTYNNIKARIGIEPFVKILPHLMKGIGVWKKDSGAHLNDSIELEVLLDFSLPQQKNGYLCDHNFFISKK
ncbi:sentrin-specific protease 1-like [Olea europaea subsp. europaea]|uniref:Sentrin-specific protease 1-like n=1 Tax=Olea europaea subsp. europaea TaxID=158383 RepID=A0A8S0TVQ4_OLEEU|nr:sentrin-specific protease 1-like [Olea europaea subsp. europaea]